MDWESFKFPIGSLVRHRADEDKRRRYVVLQQRLLRTPGGVERSYLLDGHGYEKCWHLESLETCLESAEPPAP